MKPASPTAKISSITNLALASTESNTDITTLLAKCGALSATADATLMNGDQKGAMAAESAIGLAILVVLFRQRRSINVDDLDAMRG